MRQGSRTLTLGLALAACGALFWPTAALAWGQQGHRIVARIAQRNLSPKARQEVRKLLRPGETLESVATWADVIRDSRPETKRWHYVDIPLKEAGYDPARDCQRTPLGDCIIQALDESRSILADPARLERLKLTLADERESRQTRAEALKFLVHFVGDLHQPLHCADNDDAGGNKLKVTFFGVSSNLHKVWDTDIIARAGFGQTANRAAALPMTRETVTLAGESFVDWALEAHRLAAEHAYQNIPTNKRLGQDYYLKNRSVIDGQLQRAGLRLAKLLNEVFNQ
jgi:hypothetical protein